MPETAPLPKTIAKADIIVVAELESFTIDSNYKAPPTDKSLEGMQAIVAMTSLNPPGQGMFHVLRTIKGQCGDYLKVKLPQVLSVYYSHVNLPVKEKMEVILMLDADGGLLQPVDSTIPFIMLARPGQSLDTTTTSSVSDTEVYDLMFKSTVDPLLRSANIFLLRSIKHPYIKEHLLSYTNDPELNVRDDALYGLAVNQQLTAIPQIAQLEQEVMQKTGKGIAAVGALENYRSPDAVPYLNPLLFATSQYARLNAMAALQNLGGRSSLPYLMLTLFDPEEQNVVGYSAYRTLHRLVPALGRPRDPGYFEVQREAETARVLRWWKDELSGKHPQLILEATEPTIEISALPLEKLNALVFDPSTETRQKAFAELEKRADSSSIPYLVLALYDPNEKLAFGAYTKLHQLIPKLPVAKDQTFFVAQRKKALLPVFDWWEDELLGKHIQPVKVSQRSAPTRRGIKVSQAKQPLQQNLVAPRSQKVEPVKVKAENKQKSPFTQIVFWSGASLIAGVSSLGLIRKFC